MSVLDEVCKPYYLADMVAQSHLSQDHADRIYTEGLKELADLRAERDLQYEKIQELEQENKFLKYAKDAFKNSAKVLQERITELEAENKRLKDKVAEFIYGEDHPDEVEKCEQCEDKFGGELVDGRCRNCRDNDFDKYGGKR